VDRPVRSEPHQPLHTAIVLDVGDLTARRRTTCPDTAVKAPFGVDTGTSARSMRRSKRSAVCIELALAKHQRVIVSHLPGNHNHQQLHGRHVRAGRALPRQRPRERAEGSGRVLLSYEFGKVLLAAHHGDKAKADRMVHFLADQYAEMWGRTKHRFLFTGHLHHHKSQAIGGVHGSNYGQLHPATPTPC
jgi:hypothetical protein